MNVAIAAAHAMEFSTFRRYMGRVHKVPLAKWSHYVWKPNGNLVILLETGIGPENASGALAALIQKYPLDCLINFGSAGMIRGDYHVGDGFLADEVVDVVNGTVLKTDARITQDIASFLDREALPYQRGRLASSPEPIIKCLQRSRLAQKYHAGAVDMEAFALNQLATEHGIPFATLKMISDRSNAATRLEYWYNLPRVDKTLGKLMHGFLEYLKAA
jgi:adenosylhomocysteine nucleosidase